MQPNNVYIVNGRLQNNRIGVSSVHYFKWRRFALLLLVVAVLVATNPANDVRAFLKPSTWKKQPKRTKKSTMRRFSTNYGIFSVEKGYDGVALDMAAMRFRCQYMDPTFGLACETVASTMCHGKPLLLDDSDRVHTVHRIICAMILLSASISFCFRSPFHRSGLFQNRFLDHWVGIVYPSHLINDLIAANTCLYPALKEINRILPLLKSSFPLRIFDDLDVDFSLIVFFFVVVACGTCNLITSALMKRRIIGFRSVQAASLACFEQMTLHRNRLFSIFGQSVGASSAYWTTLVLIVLRSSSVGEDWLPDAVQWILSGWVGSVFGRYLLENQIWLGNLFHFVGLF